MEQLAILKGVKMEDCMEVNSVIDKIKRAFMEIEAKELVTLSRKHCFPLCEENAISYREIRW